MNLVERYLAALGRELPASLRADIVAELRDELMSMVEEREASLRRPLDRRELEALLVEFGHPLVIAGRYRKIQHLIGPEVFPFWWAALRAILVVGAAVYAVIAAVGVVATGDFAGVIAHALPSLWQAFLITFAIVTLVAAGVERSGGVGRLARWRSSQLPPLKLKTRSRFDTVVEIGVGAVFILWWVGLIHFRDLSPLDADLVMAPTWDPWRVPVLAYVVFELVANLVALLRPAWARTNAGLRFMRNLAGAGLLYGILQTGPWFLVAEPGRHSITEAALNRGVQIGLGWAAVVMLVMALHSAWRFYQALGRGEGPNGAFSPAA